MHCLIAVAKWRWALALGIVARRGTRLAVNDYFAERAEEVVRGLCVAGGSTMANRSDCVS